MASNDWCAACGRQFGYQQNSVQTSAALTDNINHPPHYTVASPTTGKVIEAIDIIETYQLGFRLGNVVKYVLRADRKGKRLEDLKKAKWYLDREIAQSEMGGAHE